MSIISSINQKIEDLEPRAIGVETAWIMFGTGLGSINAAIAVKGEVSLVILMVSVILAMTTLVMVLSKQTFKLVTWSFIINIIVSVLFLVIQLSGHTI